MKKKTTKTKRKVYSSIRSYYPNDDWRTTIPTGRIEEPGVYSFLLYLAGVVTALLMLTHIFG